MTRDEAKLLLQACRPDGRDLSQPAFAEALALAGSDAELKAWWEARQSFDRKVSAKLEEIPVPAHLRDIILAGHKMVPLRPRYFLPYWLAAAALLAILVVLGNMVLSPKPAGLMASDDYTASILPYLGHDDPALAITSPDREQVMAWLKEHRSPTGGLPANMTAMPTVGCQTLAVHGHTVSLICFATEGGGLVHLFIVERQALSDPPGSSPEYKQNGDWSTAAWSDGDRSYVLATRAGPEMLKRLL